MVGLWTLGSVVYAMVNAVKCVNLAIHRPVPLGLTIHYMLIIIIIKKSSKNKIKKPSNNMIFYYVQILYVF